MYTVHTQYQEHASWMLNIERYWTLTGRPSRFSRVLNSINRTLVRTFPTSFFHTPKIMDDHVDEETPLLAGNGKKKTTPLPWAQFTIVMFLQLAEPLSSSVIYPFMPQVRRSPFLLRRLINYRCFWESQSLFVILVSRTAMKAKWDIMLVS